MKELLILALVAGIFIVLGLVVERWMGLHPGRGTLNLSCDLERRQKSAGKKTTETGEEKKGKRSPGQA